MSEEQIVAYLNLPTTKGDLILLLLVAMLVGLLLLVIDRAMGN